MCVCFKYVHICSAYMHAGVQVWRSEDFCPGTHDSVQACPKLDIQVSLVLNSWVFCLHLPSPRIIGKYQYTLVRLMFRPVPSKKEKFNYRWVIDYYYWLWCFSLSSVFIFRRTGFQELNCDASLKNPLIPTCPIPTDWEVPGITVAYVIFRYVQHKLKYLLYPLKTSICT